MRGAARFSLLLFCALTAGVGAAAAATRVALSGETESAEICRFPAGDPENPFGRWLRSQDLTCGAAGTEVSFPPGLWNVFARSPNGISIEPMLINGALQPESIALSLVPATTLRVQLPPETAGVVYIPRRATAFPAAERMSVPAGEELWLLVVSKSTPLAVIEIPGVPYGSERAADARAPGAEGTVLGWLHVSDEDRMALKIARGVHAPQITATSGAKRSETLTLPGVDLLGGAFVMFRDVPAGAAEVRLAGRGWLTHRRQIRVDPRRLTAMTEAIVAGASATLTVNWSVPNNLAVLDQSIGSCEPAREVPRFELTMSSCTPAKGSSSPPACQPLKTESLRQELTFGTSTIDEVPPGLYRAELRYGKLPAVSVTSQIAPLSQRPLFLNAEYFEAYGNFTRGEKPIGDGARIDFPSDGVGFSARDSGEYRAVLTQPFAVDAKINISTCGGEKAFVLADRPLARKARFDIDIPDNSLAITVVDTFTRAMVTKATLRLRIMSKFGRFPLSTTNFADSATFTMRGVPERELRIEVTAPGYKKKDVEPFSITRTEKKEIEVELEPLSGRQGKILSSHPFENGMVFWYSASGSEIERADIAPDGTFAFDADHYRDETMTVVSSSHPLWILRPPTVERSRTLQINFPDTAPIRQAEATILGMPARATTVFGVAIGALRVPQPVLAQHQARRSLTTVVQGEGPLLIPALAETGPIDILRGPTVSAPVQTLEFFAVRDFAPAAAMRLQPNSASVVFVSSR